MRCRDFADDGLWRSLKPWITSAQKPNLANIYRYPIFSVRLRIDRQSEVFNFEDRATKLLYARVAGRELLRDAAR
jgi:hypothetical protein